uniref:DNA-directed RNA polymerase subunit beta n=1 Tax=Lambia antarctica TaxID=101717 RepID=A0A1L2EE03_9CHLO|nr:DNA-directed RNA polymerase subunit beta [Lambia antarctica]ANN39047.1 DNA-directed RNA polymerase subunit beta [Lambia antarctica]
MNNKKNRVLFQWVFLGNLPLMTKRGHFIINGSPRVIVNQIIRSPGIYYQQQIHKVFQKGDKQIYRTFFVDIISQRGVWVRIELDKKRQIWVCMKKTPKIPMFVFLKSLGFSKKSLYEGFFDSFTTKILQKEKLPKKKLTKTEQKRQAIWKTNRNFLLYITQNFQSEKISNQNFITRKFLNPQIYDLGHVGRKRLNQKLGLKTTQTILTPLDFLRITYKLVDLVRNQNLVDDIDNLANRRIRTVGELLQIQFYQALFRLEKILQEKIKKYQADDGGLNLLFTTKPLNSVLREFFGSCQLSQFLDQTNPLAELTHKRRISSLGPNGIQRETAGMDIRGIHSTYFGRICPIETPEGQNAGLVNSLTIFAQKNADGFLESIFYKIYKGQIQKQLSPILLSADNEQKFPVNIGDTSLSKLNFFTTKTLPARYRQQLMRMPKKSIQLSGYSSFQMISIATSLIPFLEHNDANRVLMGSNMQRQAVPLLIFHSSKIRNNLENRVISDSGYCSQIAFSGLTLYQSKNQCEFYLPKIFFRLKKNSKLKKSRISFFFYSSLFFFDFINDFSRKKKSNQIKKFSYLNKWSFVKNPQVNNQSINKKRLNSRKIFYLKIKFLIKIYKRFCFAKNKKFSINVYKSYTKAFTCLIKKEFENKKYLPTLSFKNYTYNKKTIWLKNFEKTNQGTYLIQKPLINTLDWVQKGDILSDCSTSKRGHLALGQNLLIAYLPWEGFNFEDAIIINEQLVLEEKYTSLHIEKYEIEIRETLYGLERITATLPINDPSIEQLDNNGIIKLGCLVNEGTILVGKVTPIENKPLLPHEKLLYDIVGKEIERVKDTSLRAPKSTFGRILYISINNDQYTGSSFPLKNCQKICIYVAEKRKIKIGDKMAGRHGNKGVISKILPRQDLPFLLNGESMDILLNPLGVPSRMNVGQLFECLLGFASDKLYEDFELEIFDEKYGFDASRSLVYYKLFELRKKMQQKWYFSNQCAGKMPLFDGRTGEKFQQTTTVGKSYIMKLIHLVDDKMHARSTGPYSLVTQQPLKGRSKHGGQRFGEMEVWALEGFGSAYILQELLTVKSDDTKGRTKIIENILKNSTMVFGTPESFKVLLRELQSLCLDINICQRTV